MYLFIYLLTYLFIFIYLLFHLFNYLFICLLIHSLEKLPTKCRHFFSQTYCLDFRNLPFDAPLADRKPYQTCTYVDREILIFTHRL